MPELRHRLAVAGLVMIWERATAADGRAYVLFELTERQVQDLADRRSVTLDGARLGLPGLVVLTGGRAWDARREAGLCE